jgi:hypothetical protein
MAKPDGGRAASLTPLLVSRKNAAEILGDVSVMMLIRMEARGELQAVRLNRTAKQAKFFIATRTSSRWRGEDDDA